MLKGYNLTIMLVCLHCPLLRVKKLYCLFLINPSMRTWLCLNSGCDWITGLTSRRFSSHSISNVGLIILKCLSQSLSSERFGLIPFQKCQNVDALIALY